MACAPSRRTSDSYRVRLTAFLWLLVGALLWGGLQEAAAGGAKRSVATAFSAAADNAERFLLAASRPIVKVARAPFLERLAVTPPMTAPGIRNLARALAAEPVCDRRRELRRFQTRRRVPRMNAEEPPWG